MSRVLSGWLAADSEPDHDVRKRKAQQPSQAPTRANNNSAALAAWNALAGVKKTRRLPPPTLRQMIILDFLDKWIKAHENVSPTFRELATFASCKSVRTVCEHIHSLRRKGLVVNLPREMRTLYLTVDGEKALAEWKRPPNVQHVKLV